MKVVFTRSYLIRTDSRLHRYFAALDSQGVEHMALAWDRTGVEPDSPDCVHFHRRSPVGGGVRNLGRILAFNGFCLRELWRRRHQVGCVHAVDLDGALGATVFALLARKRLIFDAFDKYSDTRNLNGPMKWVCDRLERACMRVAHWVLVPDESRIEQHRLKGWKSVSVIENVPSATSSCTARDTASGRPDSAPIQPVDVPVRPDHAPLRPEHVPIRLAYVGTLEPVHRGLEDLLAAVAAQADRVQLTIAGTGPLADTCRDYAARFSHIDFLGEVLPREAMAIMARGDIVVGMYYLSSRNHRYAAPNKYYEHLLLGKALLTTAGTPPGQRVLQHETGWAINDSPEALQRWLADLQAADVIRRGQLAAQSWRLHYAGYFDRVLVRGYAARVQQWLQDQCQSG